MTEEKVSPSSLDTAENCLRKWAWGKIAGLRGATHPSAALGTLAHAQFERHFKGLPLQWVDEPNPDFPDKPGPGLLAMQALYFAPTPGPTIRNEVNFSHGPFHGFVDLLDFPGGGAPPLVVDLKTTSNLTYAKTPETLESRDWQSLIYGDWAASVAGAAYADVRWIYVRTSGRRPPALPVDTRVYRDDVRVRARLDEGAQIAEGLLRLKRNRVSPLLLPPNPMHCRAYGGCSFVSHCNLSPDEQMKGLVMNPSTLEQLAAAVNPTSIPALAPTFPTPAPVLVTLAAAHGWIADPTAPGGWRKPEPTPAPVEAPPPFDPPPGMVWAKVGGDWTFQPATPAVAYVPSPNPGAGAHTYVGATATPTPAAEQPAPDADPGLAVEVEPVKRGRGRPKGSTSRSVTSSPEASAATAREVAETGDFGDAAALELIFGGARAVIDGLEMIARSRLGFGQGSGS